MGATTPPPVCHHPPLRPTTSLPRSLGACRLSPPQGRQVPRSPFEEKDFHRLRLSSWDGQRPPDPGSSTGSSPRSTGGVNSHPLPSQWERLTLTGQEPSKPCLLYTSP